MTFPLSSAAAQFAGAVWTLAVVLGSGDDVGDDGYAANADHILRHCASDQSYPSCQLWSPRKVRECVEGDVQGNSHPGANVET